MPTPLQISVVPSPGRFHGLRSPSLPFGGMGTRFQFFNAESTSKFVQPAGSDSRALLVSFGSPASKGGEQATKGHAKTTNRARECMMQFLGFEDRARPSYSMISHAASTKSVSVSHQPRTSGSTPPRPMIRFMTSGL